MLNKIPIIGWMLSAVAAVGLAVPFWLGWTAVGIGAKYFYWLPDQYHVIPFWDAIWLFIVIAILKETLIPRLFHVSNNQEVNPP